MLVKTVEQRSGLSRDTLRFYERSGLITPPARTPNGYRRYDEHTLVELRFIAAAREIGFTLAQIKEAVPKLKAPPAQCAALQDGLRQRRAEIQEQMALGKRQLKRIDQLLLRLGGA
jgi:DNA-binding transcriptional MerR regulator